MMPLRMRELGGEATWSVLYKGHNKGASGVPKFLRHGAENIQYALCASDLHFCGTPDRRTDGPLPRPLPYEGRGA